MAEREPAEPIEVCAALYCNQEAANHTLTGEGLCPWHFNEYARGRYPRFKMKPVHPAHQPQPTPKETEE